MNAENHLTVLLTGQSLIKHDLREGRGETFRAMCEHVRSADVAFTNFEGTMGRGLPRKQQRAHGYKPDVLEALKWMGFSLVSLANNHAFDYFAEGLLATIEESAAAGLATAGVGKDLTAAHAPGVCIVGATAVALVAMDGMTLLPEEAAAQDPAPGQPGRPGINPLRPSQPAPTPDDVPAVTLREDDVERNLRVIAAAAGTTEHVIVYVHDHLWMPVWTDVAPWKRDFARRCIEAGATMFVGHGVPAPCAIEIHRGRPIFYGLGNFIFHSTWDRWHVPGPWHSAAPMCTFEGTKLTRMELAPVLLADENGRHDVEYAQRRYPVLGTGDAGREVLELVAERSRPFGTAIRVEGVRAVVEL